MLDETSTTPLYKQLKADLLGKIHAGDWTAGNQIPAEVELCAQYGVSRMTVRLAVNELKSEGYLYRKQGKGTFVTVPRIEQKLSSFYSFSEDITRMGYKVKSDVLSFSIIECSQDIAARLCVEENTLVYEIRRIRYVNEQPFAYETSYIPYSFCTEITRKSVLELGLYNTLRKYSVLRPDMATEAFEAIVLDQPRCELLKTKRNTPGFHIKRVTSSAGMIFEYCESYVRGDILIYNVVLK